MIKTLKYLEQRAHDIRKERGTNDPELLQIYDLFFELTDGLDEHPENWNEPCLCDLCRSYA